MAHIRLPEGIPGILGPMTYSPETAEPLNALAEVKVNFDTAPISSKLKASLTIAGKMQQGGEHVTADNVANARLQGATDKEIHDAVLIASALCMYNRENGRRLAEDAYLASTERLAGAA